MRELISINRGAKAPVSGVELLAGLVALVLPGGFLLMYALWHVRRSQESAPKPVTVKA